MIKTIRVIHLIDHAPAYSVYADSPRPQNNWNTASGDWVGIWGSDWADQIGLKLTDVLSNIVYEVWQPDERSDKVYQAILSDKVVHKNFPATKKSYRLGLKRATYLHSRSMLCELEKYSRDNTTILIVPFFLNPFVRKLGKMGIPILYQDLGLPQLFYGNSLPTQNPIIRIHRLLCRIQKHRFIKDAAYLVISKFLREGRRVLLEESEAKVFETLVGVDLEIYKPLDRLQSKQQLGIDSDQKVLFSSSRLTSLKQIDKLILSLADSAGLNFKLFISGHGEREYENYLLNLIEKLELKNHVFLIGYVPNELLITYYGAADVFINPTGYDGGPISAWKAMAMDIPIINTDIGNVYSFLKDSNAGVILDRNDYTLWPEVLKEVILDRRKINTPNLDEVRSLLNWTNIAQEYSLIFKEILQRENYV